MKRNFLKNFGFVIACMVVVFCCSVAMAAEKASAAKEDVDLVADPGGYKIGIADVLEVLVWKEPDLSRTVDVRPDGRITFPLLDDIKAAGLTTLQLKNIIQKKLGEFVESPAVTVTLKSLGSQKFYILGEVAKTGEYPLVKDLSVLQAFAIAGGFTEWASKKEILLLRDEGGTYKAHRVNYKDIANNKDISTNIPIRANDTIIVP